MASIEKKVFGSIDDKPVHQFIISNSNGITAKVSEYGALLTSLQVPDTSGTISDITHGFDTLEEWVTKNKPYFGATIGRFGNRISHGRFKIGDKSYQLATQDQNGIPVSLHGGPTGFNTRVWEGKVVNDQTVELSYTSVDGEEGYPGTVEVKLTYSLNEENELKWEVHATTDAPTVFNMVHHTYWNLSGNPTQTILDQKLQVNAPSYLPTNKGLIPTGEFDSVTGTPMDFTTPHIIGERIDNDFEALNLASGYDHCWVLENESGKLLNAARVEDPKSGRVMEILTNQPGIQVYAGNFLDGSVTGKGGVAYPKRSALCLETQGFPDAPNQPDFPSSLLLPGDTYKHTLIHKFSTC